MKILHIVYECVPGSFAGGVQKMVAELASAQAQEGHQVEIWTIGHHSPRKLMSGAVIRYFEGWARWGAWPIRRELLRHHRKFDVVHAHNTYLPLNRYVAMVARRGARVFYHTHGAVDPKLLRGWSAKALKKRAYIALWEKSNYDSAKAVFGLTTEECRQIERLGTRAAIYELGNGIVAQAAATGAAPVAFRLHHRIALGQPVILFIGRITHKKGLHHLVDALGLIRRQQPDALLVICGGREQDPEYAAALDEQIARVGLDDAVRWVGFVDEESKRAAFGACTVFAHPSYSEGMAMAVLEAMSFGVATVVTPGCYMDAAVAAGALMLAQQSPESIAATILELLGDPARAAELGGRARDYVREHHAWPAVARKLAKIYTGSPEMAPFREAV